MHFHDILLPDKIRGFYKQMDLLLFNPRLYKKIYPLLLSSITLFSFISFHLLFAIQLCSLSLPFFEELMIMSDDVIAASLIY